MALSLVPVLKLLALLALIGLVAWALITYVPMPQPIRGVIVIVAAIVAVIIAAGHLGL